MREPGLNSNDAFMQDFRMGKETAFSAIFHEMFPALCFYALKYTDDQVTAEDIAEESLIKIWKRREMFFNLNVLKSYLYTTARNASLTYVTTRRYQDAAKKEIKYLSPERDKSFLEDIIRAEVMTNIKVVIEELPSRTQQVLQLIFFERKKIREVAVMLGVSQVTVKSHKAKALAHLRKRVILPVLVFFAFYLF